VTCDSLSIAEARRLALASQGFDKARPKGRASQINIGNVIRRLGLLQLDFVNVLVPAHYLVIFSRLGNYRRETFNELIYGSRGFTEHWAHEASIVPVESWPLLKYRRDEFKPWPNSPIMRLRNNKKYLDEVIDLIRTKGAVTSADLEPVPGPKRKPGDWHRSVPRWALEYHFGFGRLAIADRLPNFQRKYDLPERLIDRQHLEKGLSRVRGQRELLMLAAKAFGIATLPDLADYYRIPVPQARPRLLELQEQGRLMPVRVEGWRDTAYVPADVRIPRPRPARALLSPFDPLVWFRPRAERLFDFRYRIEIYVPAAKRKWGYYVLPFLLGDRIVARVDLKADRAKGCLLVQAAHAEDGIDVSQTAHALAEELRNLADWLELPTIKVGRRGTLARRLGTELR